MLEGSYSLFLLSFSLFHLKRNFIYSLSQKTFLKHPLEVFSEVFNNLTFAYIWETKKILKNPPNRNRFPKTTINLCFGIVAYLQKSVGYFKNFFISFYNVHKLIILAHFKIKLLLKFSLKISNSCNYTTSSFFFSFFSFSVPILAWQ